MVNGVGSLISGVANARVASVGRRDVRAGRTIAADCSIAAIDVGARCRSIGCGGAPVSGVANARVAGARRRRAGRVVAADNLSWTGVDVGARCRFVYVGVALVSGAAGAPVGRRVLLFDVFGRREVLANLARTTGCSGARIDVGARRRLVDGLIALPTTCARACVPESVDKGVAKLDLGKASTRGVAKQPSIATLVHALIAPRPAHSAICALGTGTETKLLGATGTSRRSVVHVVAKVRVFALAIVLIK